MEVDRIGQKPARPANADAASEQAAVRRTERTQNHARHELKPESANPAGKVEISARARELARARKAVEDAPDVRNDRVNSIRDRIKAGTYDVPAEEVAKKLLGG
jgi:negative regulator of flagellin synthesis FlgM